MSNLVALEKRGDSAIIRFTRPELRNPLSVEVLDAIEAILDSVSRLSPRLLVFTGTDEVFASGADLREIGGLSGDEAAAFARKGQHLMARIAGLATPSVAAVNGFCYGGGLDLALSCGRRIAIASASFCHPGAGLGIMTGWGGTQRLPRLIGEARALEIFFTAAPIRAAEALRIGLIDRIDDDPLSAALLY